MLGVELHTNRFVETQWTEMFCILLDKTQNVDFSVDMLHYGGNVPQIMMPFYNKSQFKNLIATSVNL